MDKVLNQLVERLRKAYGERLTAVILYGSLAAGNHHEKFSDLNVLCVLTEISPRELAAGESIFQWWREQGSPSPLLLSEAELAASADCFAIEFKDIQRYHRLLHGRDVVSDLVVRDVFYRAQVEHDLRAKLLRLRQKAAGMFSETDLLRRLLADSISTFCVLFRHALLLHGLDAGPEKRQVIEAARDHFGIDSQPFERLLDLREEKVKPGDVSPEALLGPYLRGIEIVIDAVDRVEK
jgi:hypothetical protein